MNLTIKSTILCCNDIVLYLFYMEDKHIAVKRARIFDEPFAIKKLAYMGYKIVQGTDQEDWDHIDIKIVYTDKSGNDKLYTIDVKRNEKRNAKSKNFCFTYINGKGQHFPFSEYAYFFFIDELNYKCYLVNQVTFANLLMQRGIELTNPRNGRARLIKISDVAQIASTILDCDKYDIEYLQNT